MAKDVACVKSERNKVFRDTSCEKGRELVEGKDERKEGEAWPSLWVPKLAPGLSRDPLVLVPSSVPLQSLSTLPRIR